MTTTEDQIAIAPTKAQALSTLVDSVIHNSAVNDGLEEFCRDWEEHFETAATDCRTLSPLDEPTYLLDFDVVLSYLQQRSSSSTETLAVDFLITSSRRPYALPLGAFQELTDWLGRISGLALRATDQTESKDSDQVLARLQDELAGVHVRSGEEPVGPSLLSRIVSSAQVVMSRLESFLLSSRFQGLVGKYDPDGHRVFSELLANSYRPYSRRDRKRSMLDKRDAYNLSIAASSFRMALSGSGEIHSPSYILVTRTISILKLPTFLADAERSSFLKQLAGQLNLAETTGSREIQRRFPVINPFRAAIIEMLGLYENAEAAGSRARQCREECQAAQERLERLNWLRPRMGTGKSTTVSVAFDNYVRINRKAITTSIQTLMERLSGKDARYRQLEKFRSTNRSIDSIRQTLTLASSTTVPMTPSVLRLFDGVMSRLNATSGYGYDVERVPSHTGHRSWRFVVNQAQLGPIIAGETYTDVEGNAVAVVMRWPTDRDHIDFWDFLDLSVLPHLGERQGGGPLAVQMIDAGSTGGDVESLVIVTSHGVFAAPLGYFTNPAHDPPIFKKSWRQVQEQIQELSSAHDFEFQQIRLNTEIADFVFDLVPPEDDFSRYASVISRRIDARLIVDFGSRTAAEGVFHDKLLETLQSFAETTFRRLEEARQ